MQREHFNLGVGAVDAHEPLAGHPGKRTLTQRLPGGASDEAPLSPVQALLSRPAAAPAFDDPFALHLRAAPVQARLDLGGGELDPATAAHAHAVGTAGSSGSLPFAAQLQPLFGHHDLSTIRAHTGDHAAAGAGMLAADAFASGHDVVFASAPTLHTAAHEAAHVVQQRDGVQLAGGVGRSDDRYEQHADAVADRAVRGEPVVDLLDRGPGGAHSAAIQRKVKLADGVILSVDSDEDDVAAFLYQYGGDDVVVRSYLLDHVLDAAELPLAGVLAGRPARGQRPPAAAADSDSDGENDSGDDEGADHSLDTALHSILGELLAGGDYVFNNPPLVSSGDIYHTVGFLAILRAGNRPLPRVVIGYHPPANDTSVTWINASRAVEFAQALGFGDRVVAMARPEKKTEKRPNAKLLGMRKQIAEDNAAKKVPHHPILDQKVSTALIAYLMQVLGHDFVTRIISDELTSYGNGVSEANQVASDAWVEAQLERIRAVAGERPLVLFNQRFADNQPQHDSEGDDFTSIRATIEANDIALYTLRSYNGPAKPGYEDASSPSFAGAGADGTQRPAGINTKVQHAQLLARIREEFAGQLVGIYGSTSGTLDVAALLGIPTLSLHDFAIDDQGEAPVAAAAAAAPRPDMSSDHKRMRDDDGDDGDDGGGGDSDDDGPPPEQTMNEQDQRELLMSPFKSVVRRNRGDKGASAVEAFAQWAAGSYHGPAFSAKELGGVKPVYTRGNQRRDTKGFTEADGRAVPGAILKALEADLAQRRAGVEAALANLTTVGHQQVALTRGNATGAGMNCLIHTMVQLAANAPADAGAEVHAIRQAMIATGTAMGGEMLDPYQHGHGAALMEQFRQAGFGTQILQWNGGHLLVHPAIGGNPVRLLLHTGNHFEPLWGNNGAAIQPTDAVGAGARGDLDAEIRRAIAASLNGK